jgi:hypothetical protein
METLLVKIFAMALALSQVTTTPEAVKTQFNRAQDQQQVAQFLRAGCTHMRKAFDIEDINIDDLIAMALDDPQAIAVESKAFRGIDFADLQTAYRQFCKNEKVATPAVDLGDVIDFYNKAASDLPDHTRLKGMVLSHSRKCSKRISAAYGSLSRTSRNMSRRPSLRPKISASMSTRESTSAA